jgi:exodeoxyribonuclease-3
VSHLKVVSWNVNSVNARLSRFLGVLDRIQPDVLMLQELKCTEDKFPVREAEERGYHCYLYGQKTYNGVGLLSKTELAQVRKGFDPTFEEARYIEGWLGDVKLASIYVPNGQTVGADKYAYKLSWLSGFRSFLTENVAADAKYILGGDFNIAPDDLDVHDPKAWAGQVLCSPPEREALRRIMALGFNDSFRMHYPSDQAFSWWDYRGLSFPFNKGLRIDFILVSNALKKACVSASILREERKGDKPSDHAPVQAEFSL